MRFLAPLESEHEVSVSAGVVETAELPSFVRECAARKRDLRADMSHFLAEAPLRLFGPADSAQPECRVWHLTLDERAPAPQATLEIGNLARCHALDCTYTGEHFAYLLTQSGPGRTNSLVGYSTNPLREVCLHNARQERASGNWRLHSVVGTFTCAECARYFCQVLVTGTRGDEAKAGKMPWQSQAFNKPLYTCTQPSDESLPPQLARYSDPAFGELYREMQQQHGQQV